MAEPAATTTRNDGGTLLLIKKQPTKKSLYTIVYDIKTKEMPAPYGYSSPAFYLPVNNPCKHWRRDRFCNVLGKELRKLNYKPSKYSKFTKETSEEQALADAYTLHTIDSLSPWIQFCMKKLHVVKLVTKESIYPLQFIVVPPGIPEQVGDDEIDDDNVDYNEDEDEDDGDTDVIEEVARLNINK